MSDPGFWVLAAIALGALVFVALTFPKVVRYHRAWKRCQRALTVLRPFLAAMQPALAELAKTMQATAAAINSFARSVEEAKRRG